ncbi:flagellar hook-length control protein FliK [Methylocaldum sp.]|uniref:flagellar hook-length control protein FliK n=1 Tax=Methylocaldum sp. TaxID=1969727 RepID=UPI002D567F34|nr:flagellar hook-length control protein FliK [Methylocaldum sp.]HYE34001.1 flagellar hook-length control protein FliK [Methylocaldum sp.]
MEIRLPVLIPTTPLPQTGAQPLKLGDILSAVVQAQIKDNSFLLQLDAGGRTLTANSSANLQPGQILELQVIKLGTTPELRIIPSESDSTVPEPTVQQALRQFLPKQEQIANVIKELQLLVAQAKQTSALPTPIRNALENLLASIPKQSELVTPEGVENGLRNSGVFLEAKLASHADSAPGFADSDFKAQLLRVLDSLKTLRTDQETAPDPIGTLPDAEIPVEQVHTQSVIADTGEQTETPVFRFESASSAEDVALTDRQTAQNSDDLLSAPAPEQGEKDSPKSQPHSQSPTPREPEYEKSAGRLAGPATSEEQNALISGDEFGAEHIAQKIEAALAKVVVDQLSSLPKDDAAPSMWRLEIPFTDGDHGDAAKLLITKDAKSGSPEAADHWSITLELHPPELGTFCARIILKGGQIDTYLWSDTATTSDLIRERCEHLRARLHGAGLSIGQLAPLDRPPRSQLPEHPSPPLLDLRA